MLFPIRTKNKKVINKSKKDIVLALNKVLVLNDVNGNITEVSIDDVLSNANVLSNFVQTHFILDGSTTNVVVTSSTNVFILNGIYLAKNIDYTIVDDNNITLYGLPTIDSLLIELSGSIQSQGSFRLIWDDHLANVSVIDVERSDSVFIINPNTWLELGIDYNISSPTQITLVSPPLIDYKFGELTGAGADGIDGIDGIDGEALLWKGDYSDLVTYTVGDVVKYINSAWICTCIVLAENPDTSANFDMFIQGSNISFSHGLSFPIASLSVLGSSFQKSDGGYYVCTTNDGITAYWKMIGS